MAFAELFSQGDRIDAELVRCCYRLGRFERVTFRAGFAVSKRDYGAVRRNKVRRLMRAAVDVERDRLVSALGKSGKSIAIVFVFKGKRGLDIRRLGLHSIHQDIAGMCRRVLAKL